MLYTKEKKQFSAQLKDFAQSLTNIIVHENEWTIRGFVDIFKNIYSLSNDTKLISKILEIHLFPAFLSFAEKINYRIELAEHQNWYPDLTFIHQKNPKIKFAVDLKTTYRKEDNPSLCNGFTLGSHGEYFIKRTSSKNIQYPYNEYSGHYCLGIIYSRLKENLFDPNKTYSINQVKNIPAVINNFIFFAEEKWRIASDKPGSGNTANIGSIKNIDDILNGHGVFADFGEEYFDDYWINYKKIDILNNKGECVKLSSFPDYLQYRGITKKP